MAYEATVTRSTLGERPEVYLLEVVETDASTTSEWEVEDLPSHFTVLVCEVELDGGSATEIQPELTTAATGWVDSELGYVVQASEPALGAKLQGPFVCPATGNRLRGRANPDVNMGGTGAIRWRIALRQGLWP